MVVEGEAGFLWDLLYLAGDSFSSFLGLSNFSVDVVLARLLVALLNEDDVSGNI